MTTQPGMAPSSVYEVAPNKHGATSVSSQQMYYHHTPTTSSTTTADASGQDAFFSGLSLHDEYRYMTTGTQSKDATGFSSSSNGNLKTLQMYQAEHSTKHSALTSSQSSTPMPEEGGRVYSKGTGDPSIVSAVCRSRAASGSGIPLPELATTSTSYAQREPKLQQAIPSLPVVSATSLGTGNIASRKDQYVSCNSYYGLPSNETTPPLLSQGGTIFQSGSHASVYRTNPEVMPQASSTKDRVASLSKEPLPNDVCDGHAVRQQKYSFQANKEDDKAQDVSGRSRLPVASTTHCVGGSLTGSQQGRTDPMCTSQGPQTGSLSAPGLPVGQQGGAPGSTVVGAPAGHTHTYTVGGTEEQRVVFAGDTTSTSLITGNAQDPSSEYYVTSAQTPNMQAVQHIPGYYAPGFDYPSAMYAPGAVPATYVSYDGGVAYMENAPVLGESYPVSAYATSYGGEAYYPPPRFNGTYYMDAEGNTYWSSAAPVCGPQMYMQVPETVETPAADSLSNEIHAVYQPCASMGRGSDQRKDGVSNIMRRGYESGQNGYPGHNVDQGSMQLQQCSVQQLMPSVASFYYGAETVPTPPSEDESYDETTRGLEDRAHGGGDTARKGRRRTRTNWCCDAF